MERGRSILLNKTTGKSPSTALKITQYRAAMQTFNNVSKEPAASIFVTNAHCSTLRIAEDRNHCRKTLIIRIENSMIMVLNYCLYTY